MKLSELSPQEFLQAPSAALWLASFWENSSHLGSQEILKRKILIRRINNLSNHILILRITFPVIFSLGVSFNYLLSAPLQILYQC